MKVNKLRASQQQIKVSTSTWECTVSSFYPFFKMPFVKETLNRVYGWMIFYNWLEKSKRSKFLVLNSPRMKASMNSVWLLFNEYSYWMGRESRGNKWSFYGQAGLNGLNFWTSVFVEILICLNQAVCCSPHLYQSRLVSTGVIFIIFTILANLTKWSSSPSSPSRPS